ncbi:MAG: neutral/alkaline non-lysosomal ceramidase N-terminal domain-containing protein [Chitinophagales bacterium]|nr:neutral/alkaline non-lysosomal ceramidase N-terminal domain-containing protein [Chitinophagales bacterium]MDW8419474.1 neutral/alkaline non-lysosomal ceramidase N-terminal domain-containing protein [Chitinophagales bacterium]
MKQESMYLAGTGKADITAFVKGVGMLGYGIHYNTVEGVETPLWARAVVLVDRTTGRKVCYVNCELCFITIAIKKGVLKHLERHYPEYRYDDDNLMLTAQHTHSAPGGYSYYGLYNLSVPGFVMEVYQKIVAGIVESIVKAERNLKPAKLSIATGEFAPDKEVAFQRSLRAYLRNPEVTRKFTFEERHLAVDRTMTLLRIDHEDGSEMASINWFAVHTTSLPNTNHKINADNKGYAAAFYEAYQAARGNAAYLSIFAQGAAGDVTPRFRYNPKHPFQRGKWEGKYPNDVESAKYNGNLQYEKAREIAEGQGHEPIAGEIDYEVMYVNFADVTADPKFANGRTDAQTGPAAMGLAFFKGTEIDGPGMHPAVAAVLSVVIKFVKYWEMLKARFGSPEYRKTIERKYRAHGKKEILVESNARRILGTSRIDRIPVPAWADPAVATFKYFYRKVGNLNKPWTPKILPIQLFIIGDVALAAFPFEITTIAGKRLRESLGETLRPRGVKRVILSPYANGFSGYITTYEEYQEQMYEGGHTVFGEWSLAALQTKFDILAKQMLKPKAERKIPHDAIPPDFTEEELNYFPFYKRAWYIRQELIRARRMERKGIEYNPFE